MKSWVLLYNPCLELPFGVIIRSKVVPWLFLNGKSSNDIRRAPERQEKQALMLGSPLANWNVPNLRDEYSTEVIERPPWVFVGRVFPL